METPLLVELMKSRGRFVQRSRGQVVQSFDDRSSCSYIKSGYVKRYLISREGNLGTQSIYGPGDFFPLTTAYAAVLDQKIYHGEEQYHYEVLTKTELYSIKADVIREAAEADPQIYKELLVHAGIRLGSNIQKLENIALKDPVRRVAHLIAFYAQRFGEATPEGLKLVAPLRQQDIADVLTLSRETVTRAIVKLREKGLLQTGTNFVVPDLDKLKHIYQ